MAVDMQVCFPQELIELTSVRTVPGLTPRTLDCAGHDFTSVDEVLINGIPSPDVVVVSRERLLAQVPDSLVNSVISTLSVVSTRLAVTERSILRFRLGRSPQKVSGLLRLVQVFLKMLLTTPGTDIFAPRIGGNALKNIGVTFGKDEGSTIVSDFIVAVSQTQRQLVAIQARDPSLPPNERLLSSRVRHASFDRAESALVVSVELTSQTGRSALANLAV